ncbi:hypothetical protein F8388_027262 [Cannabis sativa]|uniref:Uncharacterized protein n=1 Tax=Cannabis sativa TaxID=3483 RepID=A0A7J6FS18_CANSA|nr:hypothetical protein F8388_027262 [Cannabis sativa]KAF4379231.1 hypothetical protein G4B88_010625 [Cannabis sativa]KAF4399556.1 hypothetical protein G4B88_022639 [Cannabis sativa]
MNKKGLAILMRTRMRPTPNNSTNLSHSNPPINSLVNQNLSNSEENRSNGRDQQGNYNPDASLNNQRNLEHVRESMHSAISMNKTEVLDSVLNDFAEVKMHNQVA